MSWHDAMSERSNKLIFFNIYSRWRWNYQLHLLAHVFYLSSSVLKQSNVADFKIANFIEEKCWTMYFLLHLITKWQHWQQVRGYCQLKRRTVPLVNLEHTVEFIQSPGLSPGQPWTLPGFHSKPSTVPLECRGIHPFEVLDCFSGTL